MARTVRYFRDALIIDRNLISNLKASPGDTIVFGAREVTLASLASGFDYVIAAERMSVAPNAATAIGGNTFTTVLAASIDGALNITSMGEEGMYGADGEPGESGEVIDDTEGGRPIFLPGGAGGNGANGEPGGPGGTVTVRYVSATETPTASAPGGAGGAGGKGGAGGPGKPPGKPGKPGKAGPRGPAGIVSIEQVDAEEIWSLLDAASAREWAAYRAEVAGYLLRKFDYESQLAALNEAESALMLNPEDPDAAVIQSRIVNRQIPSGLPRDLDIAPDFPELSANLTAEIAVVQNAFQSFVSVVSLESIANVIREHLGVMRGQLAHRAQEAQVDVAIANQEVAITKAEQANIQKQIDDVQKDIDTARDQSFTLGDFITSVGSIAGAVVAISSGIGAIISIPAGLAALQSLGATRDLGLLLGELKNAAKDPKHKTSLEQDVAAVKGLGGDLKDLLKATKSTISFVKVISDLEAAMSQVNQKEVGKLLRQQAMLVRQKMVASLREKQAQTRVFAAQLRVSNLMEDMADIDQRLAHWNADSAFLSAAADILIRSARRVVDMVIEDVFLAQRAREIYQLEGTPGLRFDFGFLHPDHDHSLPPAQRAAASLITLADMPVQVLSWIKMYQALNTAQIGFDVIHPQLSLTIDDPAQLQAFAAGAVLSFSIDLASVPDGMFELKANALHLELNGASSPQSANVWITHTGEWWMNRRTDGSVTSMSLRPRRELFAFGARQGRLAASIPANPQSNSESGPPFSFWGRGIATTFRLQIATPSPMDLSQLNAMHVTVDCVGYAPQAAGALVKIRPDVQVIAPMPAMEAIAV